MRLSAQIILSAPQQTNPLSAREISLRSLAIPTIEHLSVTRDAFDTIDLTNNHITSLSNFPKLTRLSTLYLANNGIFNVDWRNLKNNLSNLTELILSGNDVKGWNVVADLGRGCEKLEFLSLIGCPVTRRQHYRLYTIHKIPSLKVLDFTKVKQSERERAERLAKSAAGAAMEEDARLEARIAAASMNEDDELNGTKGSSTAHTHTGAANGINTFEPGEGKTTQESFAIQFSAEEKAQIREMVADAASAEEIDRIESLVKRGIFPGNSAPPPPPPPPPPLPEEMPPPPVPQPVSESGNDNQEEKKRSAEEDAAENDGGEGPLSKKQKSED